jgi:fatty acyl-CoA reductase
VLGDVVLKELGLSNEHMKKVLDDTDIVFHLAATLKLEATLKPSVEMNLIGTRNVIELAKRMPKLKSIIHLSTAFCNSEQDVMEEKVYDCPDDPNDLIRCAEWMKEETMADLGNTLIAPHPNTYTYTKRLAEIFVRVEFPNLPICIVRPSIVTPAYKEPLPGWVDSLNGPVGILVGASKGVIRVMRADSECAGEVYPVDMAINGLITIAYVNGTLKEKPKEIPVYNMTCNEQKKDAVG